MCVYKIEYRGGETARLLRGRKLAGASVQSTVRTPQLGKTTWWGVWLLHTYAHTHAAVCNAVNGFFTHNGSLLFSCCNLVKTWWSTEDELLFFFRSSKRESGQFGGFMNLKKNCTWRQQTEKNPRKEWWCADKPCVLIALWVGAWVLSLDFTEECCWLVLFTWSKQL